MHTPIIPIFIPHLGCPHQCIFCNQTKITGITTNVSPNDVSQTVLQGLKHTGRMKPEVAYYGGSFTALPRAEQIKLLTPAYRLVQSGLVGSIRISTRPDYIDDDIVTLLRDYGVTTIEIGAQSLDDFVLAKARREHTWQHIRAAVLKIKKASVKCGLQLMVGLPGEDWTSMILSATRAASLIPDFIRIYPTLVIDNTPLADEFRRNRFLPLTLHQAVIRCAYLKLYFQYHHKIKIIRTGLQATDFLEQPGTIVAGPYHPSFGEMVDSYLFYLMIVCVVEQKPTKYLAIHHHPKDHSKLRGIRNSNLCQIRKIFNVREIQLIPDGETKNQLVIQTDDQSSYIINPAMIFSI